MSDGERRVIIVKKIKREKKGHHGGSWKVAYADFVTAMMAFFLVMWIMGMEEGVRDVVEGYFSNPVGFHQAFSGGRVPTSMGSIPVQTDVRNYLIMDRQEQAQNFVESAQQLNDSLTQAVESGELSAEFEIALTQDGLRIELMERVDGDAFFEVGSATLKETLRGALAIVLGELEDLPNSLVIEGHTDGRRFNGDDGYSNWELSVDRAGATRRALLELGLDDLRLAEVRGYADRNLKLPEDPYAPQNRRITLLLPYQDDLIRAPVTGGAGAMSAGGGGGSTPVPG